MLGVGNSSSGTSRSAAGRLYPGSSPGWWLQGHGAFIGTAGWVSIEVQPWSERLGWGRSGMALSVGLLGCWALLLPLPRGYGHCLLAEPREGQSISFSSAQGVIQGLRETPWSQAGILPFPCEVLHARILVWERERLLSPAGSREPCLPMSGCRTCGTACKQRCPAWVWQRLEGPVVRSHWAPVCLLMVCSWAQAGIHVPSHPEYPGCVLLCHGLLLHSRGNKVHEGDKQLVWLLCLAVTCSFLNLQLLSLEKVGFHWRMSYPTSGFCNLSLNSYMSFPFATLQLLCRGPCGSLYPHMPMSGLWCALLSHATLEAWRHFASPTLPPQ